MERRCCSASNLGALPQQRGVSGTVGSPLLRQGLAVLGQGQRVPLRRCYTVRLDGVKGQQGGNENLGEAAGFCSDLSPRWEGCFGCAAVCPQ